MSRSHWKFHPSYQETGKSQFKWERLLIDANTEMNHVGIIWQTILKMLQQALTNSLITTEKNRKCRQRKMFKKTKETYKTEKQYWN